MSEDDYVKVLDSKNPVDLYEAYQTVRGMDAACREDKYLALRTIFTQFQFAVRSASGDLIERAFVCVQDDHDEQKRPEVANYCLELLGGAVRGKRYNLAFQICERILRRGDVRADNPAVLEELRTKSEGIYAGAMNAGDCDLARNYADWRHGLCQAVPEAAAWLKKRTEADARVECMKTALGVLAQANMPMLRKPLGDLAHKQTAQLKLPLEEAESP